MQDLLGKTVVALYWVWVLLIAGILQLQAHKAMDLVQGSRSGIWP